MILPDKDCKNKIWGITFGLYRSLTKETQKKSPIQKPYHIKVSLQEYYEKFGEWTIPDFSDKCLICGAANCAGYHGHYTRTATCPLTGFSVPGFPVMRFLCQGKGDKRECDHVTFSLLPIELVPFRQLTLKFMVLAVWIRLGRHLSFTGALDAIEEELNSLGDIAEFINISTLMSWERLIRAAFKLFLSTDINILCKSQYEKIIADETGLLLFLELLREYKSGNTNNPIRGPDAFAWDFYQQSGGTDQLALFLFGRASQHRT
ncbi:MAG: hypothetical protein JRD93_16465 [Deltaproteobacteria bacterium]|nr:hypothetical protein [Desulfobacterales bacterium]MBW2663525.1 hypothetical protein [Deltaproteobacteria bacterium]